MGRGTLLRAPLLTMGSVSTPGVECAWEPAGEAVVGQRVELRARVDGALGTVDAAAPMAFDILSADQPSGPALVRLLANGASAGGAARTEPRTPVAREPAAGEDVASVRAAFVAEHAADLTSQLLAVREPERTHVFTWWTVDAGAPPLHFALEAQGIPLGGRTQEPLRVSAAPPSARTVQLALRYEDGAPMADAQLEVAFAGGVRSHVRTDADGRASVDVPPGAPEVFRVFLLDYVEHVSARPPGPGPEPPGPGPQPRPPPPPELDTRPEVVAAFAFDSSFPGPAVHASLARVHAKALQAPGSQLIVFGHTDRVGSDAYNATLSERRANAVLALLLDDRALFDAVAAAEGWGTRAHQAMLRGVGCNPGEIDGDVGPMTRAATANFQREYNLGVYHEPAAVEREPPILAEDGNLGPETRAALRDAYVAVAPHVARERFADPPADGCGKAHLISERDHENRRAVVAFLPPGTDLTQSVPCERYGELVGETPQDRRAPHFSDHEWLREGGALHLSAATVVPDGTAATIAVVRCEQPVPIPPPDASGGGEPPPLGPELGRIPAEIHGGVCYGRWASPPAGLLDPGTWLVDHDVRIEIVEDGDDAAPADDDPASGVALRAATGARPPVFVVRAGDSWGVSRPPGARLSRLDLAADGRGPTDGVGMRGDGTLVPFGVEDGRVTTGEPSEIVALAVSEHRVALATESAEPTDDPGPRHPHLGLEVDEVRRTASPFEGQTIVVLSIDDVVRVGSPRYAVSGALVRAIHWGNLLFGASSFAIYEGPFESPVHERRYWTLRTGEPVSRRQLRSRADIAGDPGHFTFAATGWIRTLSDPASGTYLLRALILREGDAVYPPSLALVEDYEAEIRGSTPEEAVIPDARARAELFDEIDALIAAGDIEGAARRLAELDVNGFQVTEWRGRAGYLDVLVRAWTREPQERAVVEVMKASGSRSELDASLELVRRAGRFDQLFRDLDSQLFSLLSAVGERFGARGPLTLDELVELMQDSGLIPMDWQTVVRRIQTGPAGLVVGPELVDEAYEAARGFVRALGGIVDAIRLVVTEPQQVVQGVAELARLILAVELAKYGHRPSRELVDQTLRGIAREVLFGLRGMDVLGVERLVGQRVKWAVVWEVLSSFVGVGEVTAALKAVGITERIASIARMLTLLRRAGQAMDAEALAVRATRLARALRAESRLFAHEDELLEVLARLPDGDVGRLGRLLRETDMPDGATLATLRLARPELADAAQDALRRAEVLKSFAAKAGGLTDEVAEASLRLVGADGVGVDAANRIVAAIADGDGVHFAYALRAVPQDALRPAGEGADLLEALAGSRTRMQALEHLGYDAYRALWQRSGSAPAVLDEYVEALAELQRRAAAQGRVPELRELVDGLVADRPAAWQQLEDARTGRFGGAEGGGGPPTPPRLLRVPSAGRPAQHRPPRVVPTGGDVEGRLPFAPPDADALAQGHHLHYVDSAGRPMLAEGWLFRRRGRRRTPGSREAQEAATGGLPGLHGAHLIADRFRGAPLTANIVPFSGEANLSSMKIVENMLADHLKAGRQVYVQAYPRYSGAGKIPDDVTYRVWSQQPDGTLAFSDQVVVDFANNRLWMH